MQKLASYSGKDLNSLLNFANFDVGMFNLSILVVFFIVIIKFVIFGG